ncbi:MAG TPA: insulinase family protein, partial [Paludibacter sp.]|nr:insulinase family protein [Paludibacter sp.]
MNYQTHTFPSGLKLIHKPDIGAVTYCGMVINAGSRDESAEEEGMAHFIEHMLFKGTKKRRAGHIINRLENVGGELNAFTSKEETVVYAAVLTEHTERAVDLIGDVVFNSLFPQKEIE